MVRVGGRCGLVVGAVKWEATKHGDGGQVLRGVRRRGGAR